MPADQEIHQRLQVIFRDIFDNDDLELRDDMTAKDVEEWDSVSHISLILALEEEFDIKLSASAVSKLDNVGAIIALVRKSLYTPSP